MAQLVEENGTEEEGGRHDPHEEPDRRGQAGGEGGEVKPAEAQR